MPRHYVTFGQSHKHRINGITLDCDTVACYEAVDAKDGREKAFTYFEDKFFTDYHKELPPNTLKYFPKGIVNIDGKDEETITT
jgi:hypothetical protein